MIDLDDHYKNKYLKYKKKYLDLQKAGGKYEDNKDTISSWKNENIWKIHEKPIHKIFVNTGIYILDPKCLNLVPRKYYDIPSLFKKIILNKYKTISFPLGEYWMDIGKIADFERANREYYHIFKS